MQKIAPHRHQPARASRRRCYRLEATWRGQRLEPDGGRITSDTAACEHF